MQYLIEHYGYLGVLIGTFLEGETILILGGFAAHQGYLGLPGVVLCAFAGSFCSDQLLFFLGRRHSQWLLRKRPNWEPRIVRVNNLIVRFRIIIILTFRFWYGLRIVTPFSLGMSKVRWPEFIVFDIFSSVLWATVIGYAGYLFGHALKIVLGDVMQYEALVILGFALLGLLLWAGHLLRKRRHPGSVSGDLQDSRDDQ
jgi:membrane protein DedA with SNARE-associated domain